MIPAPSSHPLIRPTSWGGNCFELAPAGTPRSQGLPLDPWDGFGLPQRAPGTPSPHPLQPALALGLLASAWPGANSRDTLEVPGLQETRARRYSVEKTRLSLLL